jgi:hypothetical protein
MAHVKFSDPFPRLIYECARDIGFAILVGVGLMLASAASAKSINPNMHFQQDRQYVLYIDLADVARKES